MNHKNMSGLTAACIGALKKGLLTFLALTAGVALLVGYAQAADCNGTRSSVSVNFNNVPLTADLKVGQSITGDVSFPEVDFAKCESSFTFSKYFYGGIYATLSPVGVYNGRETFSTNVPGVGLQFGGDMPITSNEGHSHSYSGWITSGTSAQLFTLGDIGYGEVFTIHLTPKLNLVKIADAVSSGSLSGNIGYAKAWGNEGSAKMDVNFSGTIAASGCTVTGNQDMSITLEDAHRSNLPNVGSTWGESSEKDITLSCNAGTTVHITFSGAQASGTSDTSILQNNGSAKGIGVQLMDIHNGNHHPINMGYKWTPVTDSGTTAQIPIAARYIRTGDLTPGSVDASATYTLDYE